ncbi:MAG: glycosyltransferase [Planctomycetota bacterium]
MTLYNVALRALTHLPGTLLMVGASALETRLRGLAQKLKVASRVIWNSRLTDAELAGAYHAATALWLPSNARSEAFGLVQVEAMASGCPVINTDIPGSGVPWVSRHEETGLTVPMNDPDALADASRRLLKETGLRERLVQCGRERAIAHFGHSTMASRSLEVYRECLDRASDGTRRSRAAAA